MPSSELRLSAAVRQAVDRMEAEYREMPGLALTVRQAQRLWGLDHVTCSDALGALTGRRFLKRNAAGRYLREHSE